MNHNAVQHDPQTYADDEIDLRQLFRQIWQGKATVLASGFMAAVSALVFGFLTTEYVSVGLLQTNVFYVSKEKEKEKEKERERENIGLSAYNYLKYADVISNKYNYNAYLDQKTDISDAAMALLRQYGKSQDALQMMFSPVFIGSEKEQKSWGVKLDPTQAGQLFGLKLMIEAKEPNNGEALSVYSGYVRDAISRIAITDYFPKMCERFQRKLLSLRSSIVSTRFDIRQEEERIILLKPLVGNSSPRELDYNRQVVSVDGESKNFLSPKAHVSASEVKVADLRLQNERNEMLVHEANAMVRFYCTLDVSSSKWKGVDMFLKQSEIIASEALAGSGLESDLAMRLKSEIDLEISILKDGFQKGMALVHPAEQLEVKVRRIALSVLGVIGAVFGFVLGCVIVLVGGWFRAKE